MYLLKKHKTLTLDRSLPPPFDFYLPALDFSKLVRRMTRRGAHDIIIYWKV